MLTAALQSSFPALREKTSALLQFSRSYRQSCSSLLLPAPLCSSLLKAQPTHLNLFLTFSSSPLFPFLEAAIFSSATDRAVTWTLLIGSPHCLNDRTRVTCQRRHQSLNSQRDSYWYSDVWSNWGHTGVKVKIIKYSRHDWLHVESSDSLLVTLQITFLCPPRVCCNFILQHVICKVTND